MLEKKINIQEIRGEVLQHPFTSEAMKTAIQKGKITDKEEIGEYYTAITSEVAREKRRLRTLFSENFGGEKKVPENLSIQLLSDDLSRSDFYEIEEDFKAKYLEN